MKKVLIVEDKIHENIYAQAEATKHGFRDIRTATTLEEAIIGFESNPDYVVSDLFFPVGNLNIDLYAQKLMPYYEKFEAHRFPPRIEENNPILKVVQMCAEIHKMLPIDYVNNVIAKDEDISGIVEITRDAVMGIENYSKWVNYQQIKNDVLTGKNIPSGVFVIEEAKKRQIPIYVVTSNYHHDIAFEPIRELVDVKYFDTLVNGRKNWKGAFESIINMK